MIKIYTDGSCLNNQNSFNVGGWGCIFVDEESDTKENLTVYTGAEKNTTNNRMELTAVLVALKKLHKKDFKLVEIYSDSAYVINAVKNNWLKSWKNNNWKTSRGGEVKNKDLWVEFLNLVKETKEKKIKIRFVKVKGHSGNKYNEMVDREAVAAAENLKERGN